MSSTSELTLTIDNETGAIVSAVMTNPETGEQARVEIDWSDFAIAQGHLMPGPASAQQAPSSRAYALPASGSAPTVIVVSGGSVHVSSGGGVAASSASVLAAPADPASVNRGDTTASRTGLPWVRAEDSAASRTGLPWVRAEEAAASRTGLPWVRAKDPAASRTGLPWVRAEEAGARTGPPWVRSDDASMSRTGLPWVRAAETIEDPAVDSQPSPSSDDPNPTE